MVEYVKVVLLALESILHAMKVYTPGSFAWLYVMNHGFSFSITSIRTEKVNMWKNANKQK